MNITRMFSVIGIVLLVSGCAASPKYTRPRAPVPGVLPSGSLREGLSAAELKWQNVFPDEKMQKIIGMALTNNRDLKLAALNVEQARAYYGVQRAELFPSVNVSGVASRQHVPADLSSTGSSMTVKKHSVDLGVASWEIDLFGRIRSLKEKSLQEYMATEQAHRAVQTAIVSETARVYLTLAADRENLALARSTLESQQEVYRMIRKQYDNGVATELDLRRSQTQVDVAKGDIARYTQLVAQDKNALDLLAGAPVPEDVLPSDLAGVASPRDIAPGLSSDVLLRRPDIMAAEHQLKAAYAFIGAARSAFFPRISLTTTVGLASQELSGLFNSGAKTWSFVPQIAMPIFDARTWAAFRVSKAMRAIALVKYEKAIQAAFRDVADVLAVRATVDQQVAAQQSIVDSAKKVYELSDLRYTQGIDGYLGVLDAQRSFYAARQGLTYLQLAGLTSRVRLYAVLGGD